MEKLTAYLNRRIDAVLGCSPMDCVIVDSIIVTENVHQSINHNGFIIEAKTVFNSVPGVKHYTYRIDPQLGDGGPGRQRHIHIYYNGKELFAMNADSTAHDGYHQVKIPDDIAPFMRQKGFPLPTNNIIEMRVLDQTGSLICEGLNYASLDRFLNLGEVIKHTNGIAIIEANVDTFQVKCHSKVFGKYAHVNQLEDISDCYISAVKQMLVELLKQTGKLIDVFDIFDDNYLSQHKLYVAWNDLY